MPRIDPYTGCEVMTMGEFFVSEAEREGKEPHEIMEELYHSLDEDNKRIEEEYRKLEVALEMLRKDHAEQLKSWHESVEWAKKGNHEFSEPAPLEPVEVVQVIAAHSSQSFRNSTSDFTALVKMKDESVQYAVYSQFYDGGTYLDPPEGGEEVNYYRIPKISSEQKKFLLSLPQYGISSSDWYKKVSKMRRRSLEAKGLVNGGPRVRLSDLAQHVLGTLPASQGK